MGYKWDKSCTGHKCITTIISSGINNFVLESYDMMSLIDPLMENILVHV